MQRLSLDGSWSFRFVGDVSEVPAELRDKDLPGAVPGVVHTDLLAGSLIPDPYVDRNELLVQWIGKSDVCYARSFDLPDALLAHQRVDLVCQGLDTIATLKLNGRELGKAFDMHYPHRFDAKGLIKGGNNSLAIAFESPIRWRDAKSAALQQPGKLHVNYNTIRKMACNFGWDWGPALTTSGIWRPIALEAWDVARLDSVRPLVMQVSPQLAVVDVHVALEHAAPNATHPLVLVVRLSGHGQELEQTVHLAGGEKLAMARLEVPNPQLWWPRNHGAQPLYELSVTLLDSPPRDKPLDEWQGRIGLRTTRLNTDADEIGRKFVIEINDRPIYCKGASWIPDDCFPHRISKERYRQRLVQAAEAGMNMLRVWGGGLLESDDFYDACDELGIMVWQDFLFACAIYPEDDQTKQLVEQEERHNIARLSRHASLAIWCGNNECIWGHRDWGWEFRLQGRPWGLYYYLDLQPRLVAQLDPSRPYWPGSPYSGSMDVHPLDDRFGNKHVWDVWNGKDYSVYRNYPARFVSEFGWQGPPTWPTLRNVIPADQLHYDSPAMLHHQKANDGNQKLMTGLTRHFEPPADFNDWLYLMQLNQARAVAAGVEFFRSRQPRNMGALYWQINDCWPVTSWAAIDGLALPKPLWYATARFYADRLLTIQPDKTGLALYANNDTDVPWGGTIGLRRMSFEGLLLAEAKLDFLVPPRQNAQVAQLEAALAKPREPARELLLAESPDTRTIWYFERDRNLHYPAPDFAAHLANDAGQQVLSVTAKVLLRDVAVFVDRLDARARINDQLVTLLPGESFNFRIDNCRKLALEELTKPPVFQCANRFGRGSYVP